MHSNELRVRCCFIGFVLISQMLPSATTDTSTNSTEQPIAGYGFEVLLAKLDFVQYKLIAMELGLKERDEDVTATKVQLERVIEILVGAANNFTVIQADSWKILAQQTACASNEHIRKNAPLLLAKERSHGKGPFRSCKEAPAKESGVVSIQLSDKEEPFEAYCEQNSFGGGWLVIQYRFDGSLDFFRNWTEYRNGFGNVNQEFWIGLERLHQLSSRKTYELMVEMKDFTGTNKYANYKEFEIGSETEKYPLKKLGTYNGTAGDSFIYHKGMKFTTKDQDNDEFGSNCATTFEGAWWYKSCHYVNLNGRYLNKDDTKSMCWVQFKNNTHGLAYSRMMVREV